MKLHHLPMPLLVAAAFGIAAAQAQLVFTQVTGDADSGIDSGQTYTHAIDFGNGTPPTVNGVPFVADFGTAAGGIPNSGSRTYGPSSHAGNPPPAVTGSIAEVFRDMRYGGPDGSYVELTGLTPGQNYELTLYDRSWDYEGAVRPVTLSFDINSDSTVEDAAPTYDTNRPDQAPVSLGGNVSWATRYTYVAGAAGSIRVSFGIGGTGTYHFYGLTNVEAGPDEIPPVIDSTNPADDAVGVYPGADLVATFSEDIALTGVGTVTVTDLDPGAGIDSSVSISLPDSRVTVSDNELIIDLGSNFEFDTDYSVRISGDPAPAAIQDFAGTPNAFSGIADDTTWNFTTAAEDFTPPVLAATDPLSPADGAGGVNPTASLTVTFDEPVVLNPVASTVLIDEGFESGPGGFTAVNHATGTIWAHGDPETGNPGGGSVTEGNDGSAQAWGTELTAGYAADTDTSLLSPVIDLSGLAIASLSFARAIDLESGHTLEVNVIDDTSNTVIANLIPAAGDDDTGSALWQSIGPVELPAVALGQPVRIEWRLVGNGSGQYLGAYIDDVQLSGVDLANSITLKNLTSGLDTVIPVDDASQVSVSGATVTITPAIPLSGASDYALRIGGGAIYNYSDLLFTGISDDTTWDFATASTTTYTGPNSNGQSDSWNNPANWDVAVPAGGITAVLPDGKVATSDGGLSVPYTGDLNIGENATLRIGWVNPRHEADIHALGTPGSTTISMAGGSAILCRYGDFSREIPAIVMSGDARFTMGQSTEPAGDYDFAYGINGPHTFTLRGKGGNDAFLTTANTVGELRLDPGDGTGFVVHADAALSLGGNVTVLASGATPAGSLVINAADAMADTGTLSLSGSVGSTLITMNADDTVAALNLNGFPSPAGTYGRIGTPGVVDHEVAWIAGDGMLTVLNDPGDTTTPTLLTFTPPDDSPDVFVAQPFVLTFDEPVVPGPGGILLRNLSDATTLTIPADSYGVTFNNDQTVVTVSPVVIPEPLKDYAIQIDPDAFFDVFGNAYAGISDDETWNFTTVGALTFGDDFELPDVTPAQSGSTGNNGTSKMVDTSKWVRASQGYGANANGIEDEGAGFFTDPVGEQAYRFSYTNSGVTTAEGVIGSFVLKATYTVSFNVVKDGTNDGTGWRAKLVAFDDGARRDDVRNNNGTTVLAERNGNAPTDGSYEAVSFSFTLDPAVHASSVGKDVALRFVGATASANIDNVVITVEVETTPPLLVGIDDNVGGGPVTAGTAVTYTVSFDEPMNATTIGADDFENGSDAGISVSAVNATADPAVYQVVVSTLSPGELVLQIKAGAVLEDGAGNMLDTGTPIADDTTITVESGGGDPYSLWAGGALFEEDANGDGVGNGMAWALGAPNPAADALALLPTGGVETGFLTLSFDRVGNLGTAQLFIEYGNDLTGWTAEAIPATSQTLGSGVDVVVTPGSPTGVVVKVPTSFESAGGSLFARLRVTQN